MNTENNNIIGVGMKPTAEYLAFGDDSQTGTTLACAVVVVPRIYTQQVEARIKILKERFKIPGSMPLHCRVLFNKHERERKGLTHLSDSDARLIVEKAVTILNKNDTMLRYAFSDLSHFQSILTPDLELTNTNDGGKITLPTKVEPKGILGMLMQMCFCVAADGSQGPQTDQCEIFLSEDKTKIEFIGHGRKRADRHYSGFSDIGAPSGMVFQLQPKIIKANAMPILQLADIAAYSH